MDVRLIGEDGVQRRTPDEIEQLLTGPGLVWIDVRYWDAETAKFLAKRLGLHPRAVHDCAVRNPVPKMHAYRDQTFLVLHAPERGVGGHVHLHLWVPETRPTSCDLLIFMEQSAKPVSSSNGVDLGSGSVGQWL